VFEYLYHKVYSNWLVSFTSYFGLSVTGAPLKHQGCLSMAYLYIRTLE